MRSLHRSGFSVLSFARSPALIERRINKTKIIMRLLLSLLLVVVLSVNCQAQLNVGSLLKSQKGVFDFETPAENDATIESLMASSDRPLLAIGSQLYVTPEGCLCNRNSAGDKDGRKGAGDKEGRKGAGDKDDRAQAGDKDGRNAAGDKDGRNQAGDKNGRDDGGDKDTRNDGADEEVRTFGGDESGRKAAGDKDGRNGAGDKDGRNAAGDKDDRDAGGDRLEVRCRLDKKQCVLELINLREGVRVLFIDAFGERVVQGGLVELR